MIKLKLCSLWLGTAAGLTILSIIAHEIAHYLAAVAMGGDGVKLHWADVSYDPASLTSAGEAVMALAGPGLTHAIIIWVWCSRATSVAALALGLGACSRDALLVPYTLKSLLGKDTSTFSGDEVQAASALGMSAIPFAMVAVVLGVGGALVFLRRAFRLHGMGLPVMLILGMIVGIALWTALGPLVLPGGRGVS